MDKAWFTERIGQNVSFSFEYLGDIIVKYHVIRDESDAHYMWLLSLKGWKFENA